MKQSFGAARINEENIGPFKRFVNITIFLIHNIVKMALSFNVMIPGAESSTMFFFIVVMLSGKIDIISGFGNRVSGSSHEYTV